MTPPKALLLALSSLIISTCAQSNTTQQEQEQGLHSLFVAAGKQYFGTATETNNFNDGPYQSILNNANEFGQITPENSQKWEVAQPVPNRFDFANSDLVSAKAKANNQLLRCHTLTWHSQLPPFVSSTAWTPQTLRALLRTHLTNLIAHFGGACSSWDVVNEALTETGTYRPSIFFQILGESYIPLSFSIAANATSSLGPQVKKPKLYYNDFNLETSPQKLSGALRIIKLVQSSGIKIDGIGFQAHLTVGQTPSRSSLVAVLQNFTSLGLEVAFTELDVAHPNLPTTDADREQQAKDYVSVVGACLDVEKCVGVTVWQFTDKYSWVPSTFPGKGEACLWTADYEKKPAYFAVKKLLEDAAATATGAGAAATGGATASGGGSPASSLGADGVTAASGAILGPTSGMGLNILYSLPVAVATLFLL